MWKGSRLLITAAKSTCDEMLQGATITEIALQTEDPLQFAFAHMVQSILRRDIAKPVWRDAASIFDLLHQNIPVDGRICRGWAIAVFRANGVVDRTDKIRSLKPSGTTPSTFDISQVVEDRYGYDFDTIISVCRDKEVVKARFKTAWALRQVCGHPLARIGQILGGRDHSTILSAINGLEQKRWRQPEWHIDLAALCRQADMAGIVKSLEVIRNGIAYRDPAM